MKCVRSVLIMSKVWEDIRIYGTVKVGERGQIVIPSKARKDLTIKPGDLLLVISGPPGADPLRLGIGLIKADSVKKAMERIMKSLEEPEET